MNAPEPMKSPLRAPSHLMTSRDYRDSLRRLHPVVYVDGRRVESVADEPAFVPGVQALGVSYDYALDPTLAPLMLATQGGKVVPRMLAIDESAGDLLNKLEAVRVLCQETGCAQRYLAHDALERARAGVRAHRRRARHDRAPRALRRVPRARAGERPRARHRDDRRQGRPLAQAAPAGQSGHVRAHRRAHRARAWSSPAPRRSSPARRTCTSSSSCPAATWARTTPTSRSAARCRSTPKASRSSRGPRAARARRWSTARRCSRIATGSRPAS